MVANDGIDTAKSYSYKAKVLHIYSNVNYPEFVVGSKWDVPTLRVVVEP